MRIAQHAPPGNNKDFLDQSLGEIKLLQVLRPLSTVLQQPLSTVLQPLSAVP